MRVVAQAASSFLLFLFSFLLFLLLLRQQALSWTLVVSAAVLDTVQLERLHGATSQTSQCSLTGCTNSSALDVAPCHQGLPVTFVVIIRFPHQVTLG